MISKLNGHRTNTAKKLPKAVAEHFNQPGHNFDELNSTYYSPISMLRETGNIENRTSSIS